MINRIFLIVLDSAGAGAMPDADKYNDAGANTLGHIYSAMCSRSAMCLRSAMSSRSDSGDAFCLSNLESLGLKEVLSLKGGAQDIIGCFGKMAEKSPAKDTTAGHWEIAGIILKEPFPVYPNGFPQDLISEFESKASIKIIGNCAASGTEIINRLGERHIKTGYPIVYTSADSVFQIAASEETFGLNRLYEISKIARQILTGKHNVGRVIARPFIYESGKYIRTENRRDFSLDPFESTVLDILKMAGIQTIAVGKTEDIFNFRGITQSIHSKNNAEGMRILLEEAEKRNQKRSLIFANLADFDILCGHRRDIKLYAQALLDFDFFLKDFLRQLNDEDMAIITADHGCDPAFVSHTDHTREYVPLLIYGKTLKKNVNLGIRETFADISQTVSDIFNLPKMKNGKSFKDLIFNED